MTTYTVPQDDNGTLFDGLSIDNIGYIAQGGHYVRTDTNSHKMAAGDVFPVGVVSAQVPASPTSLVSGTAATITFTNSTIHRLMLQNNATTLVYFAFDATATTSSFQLTPGTLFEFDTGSALSLYQNSGSAVNINGANGITIQAW